MFEPKWDQRFLALAEHVAQWSRDPSTKVGSVIVRPDKTIASVGFNGFPRGVNDDPDRYDNRPLKYKMVVHAEPNAIVSAQESLHGYTLYVTPLSPCCDCAALIIQAGITRVVSPKVEMRPEWEESFTIAATMFAEADVLVQEYEVAR